MLRVLDPGQIDPRQRVTAGAAVAGQLARTRDVGGRARRWRQDTGPEKLAALLAMLEPYGIREMVQSGMVALGRGPRSMTQAALRSVDRTA